MRMCKDNEGRREAGQEWIYEDIVRHQDVMIDVLMAGCGSEG